MAINLSRVPADCSVETLFPQAKIFLMGEPLGYARQDNGQGLESSTPYWATAYDPCEDNTRQSDGTIDNDYLICLCKWGDEPITFRFPKQDLERREYA